MQLVGPSRALELLSSGRTVGASEALQLGLANALVTGGCCGAAAGDVTNKPKSSINDEVAQFLLQHTVGSLETMKAVKAMVNSARFLTLNQALEIEGQLFASTWGKQAHMLALDCNIKHNDNTSSNTTTTTITTTTENNNSS